jgi:hypothetical protein
MKMLPDEGELEGTGSNKAKTLINLIANRQRGAKDALQGSGYSVSGIKDAAPTVSTFKPRE